MRKPCRYQRSLAIWEKVLGAAYPDTQMARGHLETLQQAMEKKT